MTSAATSFDLFHPAVVADPYPTYQQMQSTCPVYHHAGDGKWYLSRYADVTAALRNPMVSSAGVHQLRQRFPDPALQAAFEDMSHSMAHNDGAAHTRLRTLISKAFTPHAVAAMTARIQELVDQLLDHVAAQGQMDIVHDVAKQLPVRVISDMLGVPVEEQPRVRDWADRLGELAGKPSPDVFRRAAQARAELVEYLHVLVAERRNAPRNDLLSAMVQAQEEGDRLSNDELYSNVSLLLFAGHETTTNLIGNGSLLLLRHPDQIQRLLESPALVESAVEEYLRYESPIQSLVTPRVALDDLTFGDVTLPCGSLLVALLGAANRDPAQFSDADRLDIARSPNHHVAFGIGPHFCLGAPLARLEARIVFTSLLQRFPRLRLAEGPVEFAPYAHLRALKALPVLLR